MIQNLRRHVRDLIVDDDELIGHYKRSPFLTVLFAVVRRRHAKDWFRDVELNSTNVGPADQLELHHIFPRTLLRKHGYSHREIDDLANIAFLSQKGNRTVQSTEPVNYIEKFKIDPKRLRDQFLPMDRELWIVSNFPKFIEERRRLIAKAMNDYLIGLGAHKYLTR